MCGSMVDIQSTAAEIRREKKEDERNHRMKIYIVCPITQGDHKKHNFGANEQFSFYTNTAHV